MRLMIISALVLACSTTPSSGEGKQSNRERRDKLGEEIMAMIGTPRADRLEQCKLVAFGEKPCGGPWRYLVYSTDVTDSKKLEARVADYNALDAKVNEEEGNISDCAMVLPPKIDLVEGECRARGNR